MGALTTRWRIRNSVLLATLLCFVAVGLSGCARWFKPTLTQNLVEIKPGDYRLDPDHASLLFKVDHMGFSKFVGRFNRFDASLVFDPDNMANSYLEAVVDMTSVDVNNEKFGRALNGGFWLNTKQFPQAYFKTVNARTLENNRLYFDGELTFLGVTHRIPLEVRVNGAATNLLTGKYTLGFAASSRFLRSDFGLDRFIPTVGDEIELEIHAEFQRR